MEFKQNDFTQKSPPVLLLARYDRRRFFPARGWAAAAAVPPPPPRGAAVAAATTVPPLMNAVFAPDFTFFSYLAKSASVSSVWFGSVGWCLSEGVCATTWGHPHNY